MNDPNRRGHMASYIGRRKFLATLGVAAAAWPLAAPAQQAERVRAIGVLMNLGSDDAEGQTPNAAFLQGLKELGLDRRPQRADRVSLARGRCRTLPQTRVGIARARAGRHLGFCGRSR